MGGSGQRMHFVGKRRIFVGKENCIMRGRERGRETEREKKGGGLAGGASVAVPKPETSLRAAGASTGRTQTDSSPSRSLASPGIDVRHPAAFAGPAAGPGFGQGLQVFPPAVTFCHRELGGRGHWANLDFCTGSAKHDPMTFKRHLETHTRLNLLHLCHILGI